MKRLILISAVYVVFLLSQFASIGWASPCCDGDYNCDSKVNIQDYVAFVGDFVRGLLNIDPSEICVNAIIPKTGQTTSYAPGDDGDLQMGVVWPNPRFTDNRDGTVTDNLTELIWLKDASCFEQLDWNSALSECNLLNSGECGLTDGSVAGAWRLPNLFELESLRDMSNHIPALPSGHPFVYVESRNYWSSTTSAEDDNFASSVSTYDGGNVFLHKVNSLYVWCVRGGQ